MPKVHRRAQQKVHQKRQKTQSLPRNAERSEKSSPTNRRKNGRKIIKVCKKKKITRLKILTNGAPKIKENSKNARSPQKGSPNTESSQENLPENAESSQEGLLESTESPQENSQTNAKSPQENSSESPQENLLENIESPQESKQKTPKVHKK
ncbi:hypothetical protein F8M41_011056 [Gigaspora margarita]|uniref:Uncharacterized protein n=1 Tax=Gigaspora margarita TaxID=4874 RepID=A0A8H3WZV3_GIGMA|nr:hypothetical protein F8M41_011056 [Gigaspora margarita]